MRRAAPTRIDFISEDEAVVTDGTYSTCEGPNPGLVPEGRARCAWTPAATSASPASTVVYFKGVPILGTPALSFSLSGARRSGWLPPSVGFGSKGAAEVMVPYYFNIAPNRDLTLYPRLMLDRGLQMGATGRYIGETGAGCVRRRDARRTAAQRPAKPKPTAGWSTRTTRRRWRTGLSFGWNIRAASDDEYPSDFSKSISTSAERQLLREMRTDYQRPVLEPDGARAELPDAAGPGRGHRSEPDRDRARTTACRRLTSTPAATTSAASTGRSTPSWRASRIPTS